MDRAEFKQICDDGADAGYIFCGGIRPNAAWAVEAVRQAGHKVVIITDRQFGSYPKVSHDNTVNWLRNHGIQYDELYFSADKTISPTDIFVEDKLENYDAITAAGTPCVLISRPWNLQDDSRFRINDISEYPAVVDSLASKALTVV